MCGINGFLFFRNAAKFDASIIDDMNAAIAHRGPDDSGKWVDSDAQVCLGHQRLSILDLSDAGHQPMVSGGGALVFNGEIYNYKDLQDNYGFRDLPSCGDTAVLMETLLNKGVAALSELNGMFSLAFWDERSKKLVLARDHVGIKPLYYYVCDDFLVFSSEIKALLKIPQVECDVDYASVQNYFQSNRQSGNSTVYEGIYKVPPGSYMTVDVERNIKTQSFWSIQRSFDHTDRDEGFYIAALRRQLSASVKSQMVSDVPIGAFLSGGVDSSAIVALMRENSDKAISTFSIGFEGADSYDERKYAEIVARKFDTQHFLKVVTKRDVIDMLPKMVEIFDDPLSDPTSIPIYFLCEAAKESNTKVILTGDGADEMFLGTRIGCGIAQ